MILISVKSPIVDDKRQFETDQKAMRFLLSINRLHHLSRLQQFPKPRKPKGIKKWVDKKYRFKVWKDNLRTAIPLRIEIINTKYNQLNLQLQ
jgi:hypothetical protein